MANTKKKEIPNETIIEEAYSSKEAVKAEKDASGAVSVYTGKVAVNALNVRKEPSLSSEIVKVISWGDLVVYETDTLKEKAEWVKLVSVNGESVDGFVMAEYTKVD